RGPFGFPHVNVADQRRDPQSLLNWTERIIRMRKQVPEIGFGDFRVLDPGVPGVLALRYDWRGTAVAVTHTFDARLRSVVVGGRDDRARRLPNLLSDDHSEADGAGRHHIELEPYGYRWYRAGGLDDVLSRHRT